MSQRNRRGKNRHLGVSRVNPTGDLIGPLPGSVVSGFAATHQVSYSGPIPPPAFMREYNEIIPDAAERILAMAEKQTQHRIDLENRAMDSAIKRSNWGLVAGFVIGMTAICFGGTAMLMGHETGGFWLGMAGLTSLVGVFVIGKYMTLKERRDKNAMMKRK